MEKRRKRGRSPGERIIIEVEGKPRRLAWVAENHPEILIRRIYNGEHDRSAHFSALAKVGLYEPQILQLLDDHPEWEMDPSVFIQM